MRGKGWAGLGVALLLAVPSATAAVWGSSDQVVLSVFTEQGDKAETTGFSVAARRVERNELYMEGGISYQRITLTDTPSEYRDGRVRPVFVYGRLGMDWRLSPYIQAGFDINESLLYWLNSADDNCCHVMAKTGLELKLHDKLRFDVYGSWYSVRYDMGYQPATPIDYSADGEYRRFSRTTLGAKLSLLF